jgi:Methyltransferase domain
MHSTKKLTSYKRDALLLFPSVIVVLLILYCNLKADCLPAAPSPMDTFYESKPSSSSSLPCDPNIIYRGPVGIPVVEYSVGLGFLLNARNLTDGAEVGVQTGVFSEYALKKWKTCKMYALIDVWAHQANYKDGANVNDKRQQELFERTQSRLEPFKDKTKYYRMLSTEAAKLIPDNSLDFVYLDARHDYCGVKEDLEAYWPKVRPGGIFSGHDFLNHKEVKAASPEQDWTICQDGTTHMGAVRGAVEEFAEKHGLSLSTTYKDGVWLSWVTQKPTRIECVKEMGPWNTPQ